jgi:PBP1b-binding outer membrane lipoprotein LpoB
VKPSLAIVVCTAMALVGCGAETAGTAAVVGKMQADRAGEARQSLESVKAGLDAAEQQSQERLRQAEDAANGNAAK